VPPGGRGGPGLRLPPVHGAARQVDRVAENHVGRGLEHGAAVPRARKPALRRGPHCLRREPRPGAGRRQDHLVLAHGQGWGWKFPSFI